MIGAMSNIETDAGDQFVQSLARGIEVLKAFRPDNYKMTIAQVARAAGLTRAGARRILLTLEHLGYVSFDGRQFSLTARVLELGHGYQAHPIWEAAQPILLNVAKTLNETASAGVLDGHDVVYTVRVRSSRVLQLALREGARIPAHASSIGRVLLSALPRSKLERYLSQAKLTKFTRHTVVDPEVLRKRVEVVRAQGYCQVSDEMEVGITGIAVPLIDPAGQTVAALGVSTNSDRTSAQTVKSTIVPLLREAAESIRRELSSA
jgi:IclR family transcriptional regulator, pca regulon regulatory protein